MVMRRFLLSVFNFTLIDESDNDAITGGVSAEEDEEDDKLTPMRHYVKALQETHHIEYEEDSNFRQKMMECMFAIKNSDGDQAFSDRVIAGTISTYNAFVQCIAKKLDIQRNSIFKQVKHPINITNLLVHLEDTEFPYIKDMRNGYDIICQYRSKKKAVQLVEQPDKKEESDKEDDEESDKEESDDDRDDDEEKEESDKEESDDEDDEWFIFYTLTIDI